MTATLAIGALQPGDLVDLEGDPYAGTMQGVDVEYGRVTSTELETDNCMVVYFENFSPCGFPPRHRLPLVG